MTTLSGRIGGQYSISLVGEDRYRVQGRVLQNVVTLWTGDYPNCTKLMDYCVINDAEAQTAMQHLFFDGDPTLLVNLLEQARTSEVARARRRVACTVELESDVMEGENAVQMVSDRLAAACTIAGLRVTLMQAFYAMPRDPNRETDLGRIARQRDFLLDMFIKTPDGTFSFPDGATFPCLKEGQMPSPQLVRTDPIATREAIPSSQESTNAAE